MAKDELTMGCASVKLEPIHSCRLTLSNGKYDVWFRIRILSSFAEVRMPDDSSHWSKTTLDIQGAARCHPGPR